MKEALKRYSKRLQDNCSKKTYALWWIIRICMVGIFIQSLFSETSDATAPLEILMNLALMFIWEICMAMPPRNVFRYIPSVLQTIITVGVFIAVIAGYIFNFYYEVRLWDSFMHFFCGIIGVYYGYEITCALFKMEKKSASLTLVVLASTGFCFMCTTFWEIFEFSCDQIVGMVSGIPNDVQHWSYELAQGTPKEQTLFNYLDFGRYAIMDTMGDIVLNTAGSLLGALGITLYPYRHKGKFKYDFDFENEAVK